MSRKTFSSWANDGGFDACTKKYKINTVRVSQILKRDFYVKNQTSILLLLFCVSTSIQATFLSNCLHAINNNKAFIASAAFTAGCITGLYRALLSADAHEQAAFKILINEVGLARVDGLYKQVAELNRNNGKPSSPFIQKSTTLIKHPTYPMITIGKRVHYYLDWESLARKEIKDQNQLQKFHERYSSADRRKLACLPLGILSVVGGFMTCKAWLAN